MLKLEMKPLPEHADMKKLFVPAGSIDLNNYCLESKSGEWRDEETSLSINPSRHCYTLIRDWTVVRNSHGTDTEDFHEEILLTAEEAVSRLEVRCPEAASALAAFEASSEEDCIRAEALIRSEIPECGPLERICNSPGTTVVGADGHAWKLCEKNFQEMRILEAFCNSEVRSPYYVRSERLLFFSAVTPEEGGDTRLRHFSLSGTEGPEGIAVIGMPLLLPAFSPLLQDRGCRYTGPDPVKAGLHVAKALAAIHRAGFVHLDVRPENILQDSEGHFLLADTDGVRLLKDQYRGCLRTSMQYRAPEFRNRRPFGADADVFSWGRMMLYLLAGEPSVLWSSPAPRVTDEYISVRDQVFRRETKEGRLAWIAARAASDHRIRRYADGSALVRALEASGITE